MRHHPPKHELFDYVESLVGGETPIAARTAKHVAKCPVCTKETEAIRASLEFVDQAPPLEPSEELTSRILLDAKTVQRAAHARHLRRRTTLAVAKTAGYAAGLVVAATLYFSAALATENDATVTERVVASGQRAADTGLALDTFERATAEVRTLAAAVNAPSKKPPTLWERERRHAVNVLDRDISAALAALERNPGCTRAANLVTANLERQVDALRSLYVERRL